MKRVQAALTCLAFVLYPVLIFAGLRLLSVRELALCLAAFFFCAFSLRDEAFPTAPSCSFPGVARRSLR